MKIEKSPVGVGVYAFCYTVDLGTLRSMKKTKRSLTSFLDSAPAKVRDDIRILDAEIRRVYAVKPVVWTGVFWGGSEQTIVGYGALQYERPGKGTVEWFQIGLALQKQYISVYIHAIDGKQYLVERYGKKLGKVKTGKSSVSFRSLADLDMSAFRALLADAYRLMNT